MYGLKRTYRTNAAMFQHFTTLYNQTKRMIRIIISKKNQVVYVTNINFILSIPAWICFRYKVIITAGIRDVVYAICEAEAVTIKKSVSLFT